MLWMGGALTGAGFGARGVRVAGRRASSPLWPRVSGVCWLEPGGGVREVAGGGAERSPPVHAGKGCREGLQVHRGGSVTRHGMAGEAGIPSQTRDQRVLPVLPGPGPAPLSPSL